MVVCGDLWWLWSFAVVCGRLRWFAMVCGGLSYSHTGKNLALNIRDCLSLCRDTKSRWSLLSGVYARSHQSALEMCNLWTNHILT